MAYLTVCQGSSPEFPPDRPESPFDSLVQPPRVGLNYGMTEKRSCPGTSRFLAVVLALLASSCATLEINATRSTEGKPQASDALTGGSQLAVTAFRATALAAVRQPVTTLTTGTAVFWHRTKEIVSGNLPGPITSPPLQSGPPGTPEFEQLLDRRGLPRRESGRLTWLVDGPGFFPELDRQLTAAQRSVDIQFFIYDNDDIAVRYSDRLKQCAEKLPVRVLFDGFGSTSAHITAPTTPAPRGFAPPANIAAYLRDGSKVRVRSSLNPWLVCDHTKLLVFDRRSAILGGMNMGREYYSEWHDLMVRIEGPIVATLAQEFNDAWRKAGPWGDFALFRKPRVFRRSPPLSDGVPLRLLRTDAARFQHDILEATLLAIRASRKRIWIENPYFAHDGIAHELAAAARRGVEVRVILPAQVNSAITDLANLGTSRTIIEAGGKVYRYPRMTHMKVMICDDWAQIGTANLDILSMRLNRELNVAFSDPATLRELEEKVFLPDFRVSKRVRLEETRALAAPFAEAIADQL